MTKDEYHEAVNNAHTYAGNSDGFNNQYEGYNDRFLAGLYRNGLQLTQCDAWLLIYEFAYRAPQPTSNESDLWPYDSWIIPR